MTFPLPVTEFPDHVVSDHKNHCSGNGATAIAFATTVSSEALVLVLTACIYPTIIDAVDIRGIFPTGSAATAAIKLYKQAVGALGAATTTPLNADPWTVITAAAAPQSVTVDLSEVDETARTLQRGERLVAHIITNTGTLSATYVNTVTLGRTKRA